MRFPDTSITAPSPVGGASQIAPTGPVPAVAAISGSPAPTVSPPETGGGIGGRPGLHVPPEGIAGEEPERIGEDRRKMCRRIHHLPVILDTRSGLDRRGGARRDKDERTSIDTDV